MKYIVICLSRSENESDNFRVDYKGRDVFETLEEAEFVKDEDMKNYLEAEVSAGYKASIEGNHIEWENDDGEREAKWYIYEV